MRLRLGYMMGRDYMKIMSLKTFYVYLPFTFYPRVGAPFCPQLHKTLFSRFTSSSPPTTIETAATGTTPSAKSLAMRFLTYVGVLAVLAMPLAKAQQEFCTSDEANAYIQCVANNPCTCSNCDPDPLDDVPEIIVDQPPQNCQDVARIFCPLIKCCSLCEAEAIAWYQCGFREFANQTLQRECPQTCDGFAYDDVDGDCQPTDVPSAEPGATNEPTPTPACGTELSDYQSCVLDRCDANQCTFNPNSLEVDTCGTSALCSQVNCCPNCIGPLASVAFCVQEEYLGVNPDICPGLSDCADSMSPLSSPVGSPTVAAAPSAGETSPLPTIEITSTSGSPTATEAVLSAFSILLALVTGI